MSDVRYIDFCGMEELQPADMFAIAKSYSGGHRYTSIAYPQKTQVVCKHLSSTVYGSVRRRRGEIALITCTSNGSPDHPVHLRSLFSLLHNPWIVKVKTHRYTIEYINKKNRPRPVGQTAQFFNAASVGV